MPPYLARGVRKFPCRPFSDLKIRVGKNSGVPFFGFGGGVGKIFGSVFLGFPGVALNLGNSRHPEIELENRGREKFGVFFMGILCVVCGCEMVVGRNNAI